MADLVRFLWETEGLQTERVRLFGSSRVQVRETCEIIESLTGAAFSIEPALRNIHLGVLDGLSDAEARERYPEVAAALEGWRAGKTKIDSFEIPGAETMREFYRRVTGFLRERLRGLEPAVIVGTRSVGVAIANALGSGRHEFEARTYQRFLFDLCSVSKFRVSGRTSKALYLNRADFLSRPSLFRDC